VTAPGLLARAEPGWYTRYGPVVSFEVYGIPVPQGAVRHLGKGRPAVHQNQDVLLPWRQLVAAAAHNAMVEARRIGRPYTFPLQGPVALSAYFTVAKPKGAPKGRRTWPAARPDLSHYVRAVEDAISSKRPELAMGRVLADDAQIIDGDQVKAYPGEHAQALDRPGAVVYIYTIGEPRA
jgi:Holliday junction resolvase RusA-like endonuclease